MKWGGRNAEAEQERERREGAQFVLRRNAKDLELLRLRVKQAIRRGGMKDLLEPALELIDEMQERTNRANL